MAANASLNEGIVLSPITFAAMHDQDTIVALSTPQGEGAIGVIRLSGSASIDIVAQHAGMAVQQQPPNTVKFARFKVNDTVLDEVVITVFHGPNSYTGEHVVEISFHGSPYILNTALRALIQSGARLALPGEFTQRAFLNGKLDLSQAEAVADLIATESEAEHRLAMHQMRGGFAKEIDALRQELIDFASLIELELDFAEEDVEFANRDHLLALIEKIQGFIYDLLASFKTGNAIKEGVPVAIIGRPNAGKSTLINALIREDIAIVSDIAGTTRDAIEDQCVIGGIKFRFTDTAGIRETADAIESMGVQRSLDKMRSAHVVILLRDATASLEEDERAIAEIKSAISKDQHLIEVWNKSDLSPKDGGLQISAKTGEGLDALKEQLVAAVQFNSRSQQTVVTNARHHEALEKCMESLMRAQVGISSGVSGDLVSSDIREALYHLGSITGAISTEDLLGNIFGRFCIGK